MKTVGAFLRDSRQQAGQSLEKVSESTKIRLDYLEAIEADDFSKLPSAAFVKGFIRSFSLAIKADPEKALAIFRRDFDQNQQGRVVPRGLTQPIRSGKGFWNPRTTTLVGFGFGVTLFLAFLAWQVTALLSGPRLEVMSPPEELVTESRVVIVQGQSSSDATVRVNQNQVVLDQNGWFETELELEPGIHLVVIEAEARDGKQTQISRQVQVVE